MLKTLKTETNVVQEVFLRNQTKKKIRKSIRKSAKIVVQRLFEEISENFLRKMPQWDKNVKISQKTSKSSRFNALFVIVA